MDQSRTLRVNATKDGVPVAQGPDVKVLSRIKEPSVSLAIWTRALSPSLAHWLRALPPQTLPNGRVVVDRADIRVALQSIIESSGTPATKETEALIEDVALLTTTFADLANIDVVDLRLKAISHDACWRFHRDRVPFRMITTYRGPGTEWVETTHETEALSEQREYSGPIHRLPEGAVALFRGSDRGSGAGVLHRSPPVEALDNTRLLLCVDKPFAGSPSPWRASA